jgi:hypothetical protein
MENMVVLGEVEESGMAEVATIVRMRAGEPRPQKECQHRSATLMRVPLDRSSGRWRTSSFDTIQTNSNRE